MWLGGLVQSVIAEGEVSYVIASKEQKHMKTIIGLDEKYDRNNARRRY